MTADRVSAPGTARPLLERGLALLQAGQPQAASACLRDASRLDPEDGQILYHLGNSLRLSGLTEEAATALRGAVAIDPSLFDAWFSLAFLYLRQGRGDEAAALLDDLCLRFPEDAKLHQQAASLLGGSGQHEAAAALYERLLQLQPGRAALHQHLGVEYQKLGRFEDAAEQFQQAIALQPGMGAPYMLLTNTRRMTPADAPLRKKLEAALSLSDLDEEARACLHFGLGKMHDDCGEYIRAFDHYRQGNELRHRRFGFDHESWRRTIIDLMRVYGSVKLGATARSRSGPVPAFVIGMLRSGTTLVEQLLSKHAQVETVGETELLDSFIQRMSELKGAAYPECLLRLEKDEPALIAEDYRQLMVMGKEHAAVVLDKNPLNFTHVGLIALLFPEAPIIHCRRDPLDTCLSIYFQNFGHERNAYAYDFGDIAAFYVGYERLMEFWETTLPGRITQVSYEELVEDPKAVTRDLFTSMGLAGDAEAIRPRGNTATISTASVWQARQPVYTQSVGRWRHYEKQLSGLRRALDENRALFKR